MKNPRATPQQTQYCYSTLKTLVLDGVLPVEHPLRKCPLDPFATGSTNAEKQAVQKLQALAGNWSYDLRRLYYGYVMSGHRLQNLHTGIAVLTMYDDELRQLLRSHPADEQVFPWVFLPDEQREIRHYDWLRR